MRRNPRYVHGDEEHYIYTAEQCAAQLGNSFGELEDYSQVPHDAYKTLTSHSENLIVRGTGYDVDHLDQPRTTARCPTTRSAPGLRQFRAVQTGAQLFSTALNWTELF